MKRFMCWVIALIFVGYMLPCRANAAEHERTYLNDGSYIIVEVIDSDTRASGTKSGAKQYTHYDNGGTSNWRVKLNGTFTYTGSSATCTSSSVDVTIYDSSWYVISKYATKSGNKASASVTMGDKPAGTLVSTVPVNLTLTCDANGNLS